MVFKNDVGSVNNYQKETRYSNIQYVPAVYTYEIDQKALPYRRNYNVMKIRYMSAFSNRFR